MKTSFCLLGSILLVVVHVCQAAPFGMDNGYPRPPGFPGPQGPMPGQPMPAMLAYIPQPGQMFGQIMQQAQKSGGGYTSFSSGNSNGRGYTYTSSSSSTPPNINYY